MYRNTEILSFFSDCDWFRLGGEGLIHSQLWAHVVQASLHTLEWMRTPHNHSCAGPRESQSWAKTQLTLPQARPTGYLHYRPDTAWQQEEEGGVCVFLFPFEEVPLCSPKDDLSLWGPHWPRTLLFVGVCLCVVNAYMSGYIRGCVGVWLCVCEHAQRAIPFHGTLVMKSNLADWMHDGRRYQ